MENENTGEELKENPAQAPKEENSSGTGEAEKAGADGQAEILKELESLREENERLRALNEAKRNSGAAIGSLAGGQAVEQDYYSSEEWDGLPSRLKEKFIKSGKVFEFMKKWSGRI